MMENQESIIKDLESRTARENLTGNAREDAIMYYGASEEYAEIQEMGKARHMALKAYSALLSSRTIDTSLTVVSEIIERTAVEVKCAEYDLSCGDVSAALEKLTSCIKTIQEYATDFSSEDVGNNPFCTSPRSIVVNASELNKALFLILTKQYQDIESICENLLKS